MTGFLRRTLQRFHPEGIPWPASVIYSKVSRSRIFLDHYELVAADIARKADAIACILDVGTGPAHLLLALQRPMPGSRLVGIDISAAMVRQAKKNVCQSDQGKDIDLVVAGAGALPFGDESFDCVVSTGSLHHWKDKKTALSEIFRVTKQGGCALMYDLVRHMPHSVSKRVRTTFGSFYLALLWLHSFEEPFADVEEMVDLGRACDFRVGGTGFVGALCCLYLEKT